MTIHLTLLLTLVVSMGAPPTSPVAVRLIDLTGDGLLDKLHLHTDGISVSINRDGGLFDAVSQELRAVELADALATDLDGDGLMDLYLVSPGENVALLGDGTGRFTEATERLGLADAGRGISAERVALDSSDELALLLHNTTGDVIFWATGRNFRRDKDTPEVPQPTSDDALAGLQLLLAQAAELLALDPETQIVLGLDEAGRPRVSLGPRTPRERGAGFPASGPAAPTQGSSAPATTSGGSQVGSVALTPEQKRILSLMSIVYQDDGFGNPVNQTLRISGANLQIVNGLAATNGYPAAPASVDPTLTAVNGVGNLIVGYNELVGVNGRTGSHNLIVGLGNSYTSFGGWVGSIFNTTSAPFASAIGGRSNTASGNNSSVSGGNLNTASGGKSSVSGGNLNVASEYFSSVGGGTANTASGFASSVSGGQFNTASHNHSSVSGGRQNMASGQQSSVSGGNTRTASGTDDWVAGSLFQDN